MKNPASSIVSAIVLSVAATTAASAQTPVESIATALNHFSTVVLPPDATVVNVAVGRGPSDIQVQYHDRYVLVKPLKPGISTNMAIFTNTKVYNYEILPAGDPTAESMVIREYDMAAAAARRQQAIVEQEMQQKAAALNTQLLMSTKSIDGKAVRKLSHGINVKVSLVGQDSDDYYVRFEVINNGTHGYRLEPPKVQKIDPAFGVDVAYNHINSQLSEKEFRKFRAYQQTDVEVRSATITKLDMTPDTVTDFVVSIEKPAVTPAIFRFLFPSDDGIEVSAIAVF
jgi:hypothetical protein